MVLQQIIYLVSIRYTCNTYFVMHWIIYSLIRISGQYLIPKNTSFLALVGHLCSICTFLVLKVDF